jgi:hypothetical protein
MFRFTSKMEPTTSWDRLGQTKRNIFTTKYRDMKDISSFSEVTFRACEHEGEEGTEQAATEEQARSSRLVGSIEPA